jgi:hypothetical protein
MEFLRKWYTHERPRNTGIPAAGTCSDAGSRTIHVDSAGNRSSGASLSASTTPFINTTHPIELWGGTGGDNIREYLKN